MVSPLKGLTRAMIAARAAARRAAEAAGKGNKRTRKKGKKKSTGRVRVSQKTVDRVKGLGRAQARAQAAKPGASVEFKTAVNRIYPTRTKAKKK